MHGIDHSAYSPRAKKFCILNPALEESDESRDVTLEADEEHRLIKQLLSELVVQPKDTQAWKAKFTVPKENIEHHVQEEGEMFKKARKVLSEEEWKCSGDRLQRKGKSASCDGQMIRDGKSDGKLFSWQLGSFRKIGSGDIDKKSSSKRWHLSCNMLWIVRDSIRNGS